MSNNLVQIVSDYEYVLGNFKGNVLNFEAGFQSNEWAKDELYIIAKELENTAKVFAENQGLGMTTPVTSVNGKGFSIINQKRTGTLIRSIHAKVIGNTKIDFYNNANLGHGYYAGHIEYGHRTRNGKGFVPARPFMRPALYTVAESSKGNVMSALKNYFYAVMSGSFGMGSLSFGHSLTERGNSRVFFRQQSTGRGASSKTGHYTSSRLMTGKANAKRFSELSNLGLRNKASVFRRPFSDKDYEKNSFQNNRNLFGRDTTGSVKGRITKSTEKYGQNEKRTRQPSTNIFKNVDSVEKKPVPKTGNGKGKNNQQKNMSGIKGSTFEGKDSGYTKNRRTTQNVFATLRRD